MIAPVKVERDGPVTTLTLNRPEKHNALSAAVVDTLLDALDEACSDGTRLLVLTGEGKGFSGGFDFGEVDRQSEGDLVLRFIRIEMLLQALYHAPYTTLAFAHGACYGAAADIVCCCARRVAAPGTKFRMPGLLFGVTLGTRRLAEVVGVDAARRFLETSPVFDADEARECGFINSVVRREAWTDVLEAARAAALHLPRDAQRLLLRRTVEDRRDEDLAALVRSAARPGVKARLEEFLAQGKFGTSGAT